MLIKIKTENNELKFVALKKCKILQVIALVLSR